MPADAPPNPSWEDDTQPVPPPATPPPATPPTWGSTRPAGAAPGSGGWGPTPPGRPRTSRDEPRGSLVLGVLLVVLGSIFLVTRLVRIRFDGSLWPLWIVAIGAALLIASFLVRNRGGLGLAAPGGIVLTVGLVLWTQETYDLYQTWAYAWALVAPGGVGLGMLLHGIFTGDAESRSDGLQALLTGLGLFAVFALFFEGVIGLSGDRLPWADDILPVFVIALGVVILVAAFLGPRGRRAD